MVVIPPMQVCPGDLLVYSKALTHRGNIAGKKIMQNPSRVGRFENLRKLVKIRILFIHTYCMILIEIILK